MMDIKALEKSCCLLSNSQLDLLPHTIPIIFHPNSCQTGVKTMKDPSPKAVDFSFHSPHVPSHWGEQKLLMAGKHLLIGLIVSQDCECTVAERRGEELRRSRAALIKTKDNSICAERNPTAAPLPTFRWNSILLITMRCCYSFTCPEQSPAKRYTKVKRLSSLLFTLSLFKKHSFTHPSFSI